MSGNDPACSSPDLKRRFWGSWDEKYWEEKEGWEQTILVVVFIVNFIHEFADILDNIWSAFNKLDESLFWWGDAVIRVGAMKVDGGKKIWSTDLEEGIRDSSKFLEQLCVFVFSYDINDYSDDIKRKNGWHCRILNADIHDDKETEPSVDSSSKKFLLVFIRKGQGWSVWVSPSEREW